MSIQFTEPDLQPTYQAIIAGDADYDWAVFNQSGNEIKVQATGTGLDDLEEEFMDGRIQYAFARIKDPSSKLDKFVLISWCGEGVPESRKGLYHTQSSQVSSKFLKGAHLVIQARSDLDVTPDHIHKRMQESSGSKYSSGAAAPTPTAPVKSIPSYKPSQGLGGSQGKPASVSTPQSTFSRPTPAAPAAPPAAQPAPPSREPSPPPPAPAPAAPPAPLAASRPPPVNASTPAEPSKPAADDRIAPVGTAYEPVKLAKPGKLGNRWNPAGNAGGDDDTTQDSSGPAPSLKDRMAAFSGGGGAAAPPPPPPGGRPSIGDKKLTWTERQAMAKKQQEEDEQKSKAASAAVGIGGGAAVGAAAGMAAASNDEPEEDVAAPPPPPPPAPPAPVAAAAPPANRAVPPRPADSDDEQEEDDDDWGAAPPPPPAAPFRPEPVKSDPEEEQSAPAPAPPPPPPPPPPPAQSADPQVDELQRLKEDLTLESAPAAPPPPPVPTASRPGAPAAAAAPPPVAGKRAKALYDYEADEDNEIPLKEDEIITQIEEIDEGWWSGTNSSGQSGLFPSNYCEMLPDGDLAEADTAPPPQGEPEETEAVPPVPPPPPPPAAQAADESDGDYMVAQYDYAAAEDNELSFREGDRVTDIDKVDEDWWQGKANGATGLFPAAYVVAPEDYQA